MDGTPQPGSSAFSNPYLLLIAVILTIIAWIICKKFKAKSYLPIFVFIFGALSPILGLFALGIVSYKAFIGKYGDKNYPDKKTEEQVFSVFVINKPLEGEKNIFWNAVESSEKFSVLRKAYFFTTKEEIQLQVHSEGFADPQIQTIPWSKVSNCQHSEKSIPRLPQYIKPILQGFGTSILLIVFLTLFGKNNYAIGQNILFGLIFGVIMSIVYISVAKDNIPSEDLHAIIFTDEEGKEIDFGILKSQKEKLLNIAQAHQIDCKEIE